MSDSHSHAGHAHGGGNLKAAFLLNLTFTLIEIAGGLWTNSIAILTDALHDGGDCLSLGSAWYLDRLSRRGRTSTHTYGYRRFSVLGALITGTVLLAGLIVMVWKAVERLGSPQEVYAPGMIGLAVVGILFNGAAVLKVKSGKSLAEQVVSWHLLEDTLGWGAVLVGSTIMAIWDVPIIDPILSIGISLFVLWNVIRNMRKVFRVFLQVAPASFDVEQFEREVRALPNVQSTHHTHCWSLDGERHVLTIHVVMQGNTNHEHVVNLKCRIRELLDPDVFEHVTVDVELEGDRCVSDAEPCSDEDAAADRELSPDHRRPLS